MMVPIDIWVVLAVVGVIALGMFVSVWLIRDRTKIPARVKIEKLAPDEIDPEFAALMEQYNTELSALGFEKAGEFAVAGTEGESPHRVFVNSKEKSYAMLGVLNVGLSKKGHLEFYTKFKDNGSLSTDQALVPNFLAVPPNRELHRLSAALSPEQLWNFHKQKLEESQSKNREPLPINKDGIYREIQQDQQDLIDFQVKSGLFTIDEEQEHLIPSWKFALFFMFKIIDPVPFGISTNRLIIGIGSCAVIIFGFFALARWQGLAGFLSGLPITEHQLRYIVAGLGAVTGGMLLGYVLHTRGVLWGGAISLAGYFLINNSFPNAFIIILICAYAGLTGNRIFEYGQSKAVTRFTGPLIALLGLILVGWFMLEKSIVP